MPLHTKRPLAPVRTCGLKPIQPPRIKFNHAQKPSNFAKCVKFVAVLGELGARESVKITVEGFTLDTIKPVLAQIESCNDHARLLAEIAALATALEKIARKSGEDYDERDPLETVGGIARAALASAKT